MAGLDAKQSPWTAPEGEPAVTYLSQEQARDLVALAEQARKELSQLSGREASYSSGAVQLLDEWIDDYLEMMPNPPVAVRLLWTSFLGEMFRRRHDGWWALQDGGLVVVCPTDGGDLRMVTVREQIERRIALGMAESVTYFYNATRIALKLG